MDYHQPQDLDAALALLASEAPRIAAGCTDLYPATEAKTLAGPILDITRIAGLRGVRVEADGIVIGAATTWSDIRAADLPPACDGLRAAAAEVGARQVQNRGTIGGNLNTASPAADGVPPLLTLEAEVVLAAAGATRRLPLAEFLTGPRKTARRADELLTEIRLPATRGRGAFSKLGARSYLVISIAMVAARIVEEDGIVTEAACAIGACGPVATRLPAVEARLIGAPLTPLRVLDADVAAALSPIDDIRADAGYRCHAAAELLRRVLTGLAPQ